MSIDLNIFSTVSEIASWCQIKNQLNILLSPVEQKLLGEHPSLLELGSGQKVANDQPLSLGGRYYLSIEIPNTLGIAVISKEEDFDEENLELDYLEDFGRNLESEEIQIIAEGCRAARYYYGIETWGGRSKPEPRLFIALATAIAYTCAGYVIIMSDDIFDLGVGVYTPEQFQHSEPKF